MTSSAFIIKHDFGQEIPYYVRLTDKTSFDEVYNPNFATHFKNKKDALEWVNVYSSMADHSKIVNAGEAIEKFRAFCEGGMVRRTLKCTNTKVSRPYNGESLLEVIDWWLYAKGHDCEIKQEHYNTWPRLYNLAKHLFDVESYYDRGYTTLYHTFQIRTPKDGSFDEFKKELELVLDKATYKDEDGFLIFPVFDHYLSEHGNSVSLLIHPNTGEVKFSGRGLWKEKHFDCLEDAFNYMRAERYYPA